MLGTAEDGLGAGIVEPVFQVARCEHLDTGDRHGAKLQATDHRDLPVRQARQHDEHAISPANAFGSEERGELTRATGNVPESEALFPARLIAPDQRELPGLGVRDRVDDVTPEVESVGQLPLEIGHRATQIACTRCTTSRSMAESRRSSLVKLMCTVGKMAFALARKASAILS